MVFLGIIVSIVIFSIIVIIHEYGHYKTARIFGIHIQEFWLWIPPRAKKLWTNKTGTLFSLNWIPLWGFVKISWESEIFLKYYGKTKKSLSHWGILKKIKAWDDIWNKSGQKISKQERKLLFVRLSENRPWENFYEKHILARSIVLLAWVIMNFLLAIVVFAVIFFIWVKPVWINSVLETDIPSKLIPDLETALNVWMITKNDGIKLYPIQDSISETAWVFQGDTLLRVDNISVWTIPELQSYISSKPGRSIYFYIERKSECPEGSMTWCMSTEYLNLAITPSDEGIIGSYLSENLILNEEFEYKYGAIESIYHASYETYAQIRLTLSGLSFLIKNIFSPETPEDRQDAIESVAWPIWIVWVITQSLQWWFMLLCILGAIISINLWVFNLLPIPALDGWRLLLLWIRSAVDKIFWKTALSGNIENMIHVLFFLLLIALSILIAYNDIINIFSQ